MTNAFITVAGVRFPYPDKESGLQTQATFVSGGRNARGVFIGQRVGRDQSKVELSWKRMPAIQWSQLLKLFKTNFVNPIEYYDMVEGRIITRRMYVNDRTGRPGPIDPATGIWMVAKDCKLNLTDTGEGD